VLKNAKRQPPQGKIVGTIMVKAHFDDAWRELAIDNPTSRKGNEPAGVSFF
jgi:hypothetical protein